MSVGIENIRIMPSLTGYIDDIFIIESDGDKLDGGLDIIEPDGTVKLTIALENGIKACYDNNKTYIAKQDQLIVVGMFNSHFKIAGFGKRKTKILIIRLNALGAYRFININHDECLNSFHQLSNIIGGATRELEELLANEHDISQKIFKLQGYLHSVLKKGSADIIFDYCVNKIIRSAGSVALRELEKDTGYSGRWLNVKFKQKIGISPKSYASIIRFKHVFKDIVTHPDSYYENRMYLNHYYDQAHFLKDFKRYSGQTPREFYLSK